LRNLRRSRRSAPSHACRNRSLGWVDKFPALARPLPASATDTITTQSDVREARMDEKCRVRPGIFHRQLVRNRITTKVSTRRYPENAVMSRLLSAEHHNNRVIGPGAAKLS